MSKKERDTMKTITEKEIALIGRRLNNKKDLKELAELYKTAEEEHISVTQEQAKKGYEWLMNLWKTPIGAERKNNPYGYREQEALESGIKYFTYDGHFNDGNAYRDFYLPMYTFIGKNRQAFQYYVSGGEINIIG